ncbi:MAG: divalent-cation tolerance protein CutA [Planctomycetes bacterium]|nr:divalent-cation tolerance protein CutA [Planctomycetota bacterium]
MKVSILLCTAPAEEARALADRLLQAKLVACVNLVGPVESRYWWEGRVESAEETLMVVKTAADRVQATCEAIEEWHSYDTPEVLEVGVASGAARYLAWVFESTR